MSFPLPQPCRFFSVLVLALGLMGVAFAQSSQTDPESASAPPSPPAQLRLFPSPPPAESQTDALWQPALAELFSAPKTYPVDNPAFAEKDGITALYYDGAPFEGKPTRVFAWIGFPASTGNEKFPAVVLVHGGGGTAYRDWVKLWNDRGYAAIAMDTNGSAPLATEGFRVRPKRHAYAGPLPANNGFDVSDRPPADQWMYHAVAAIIRANSLLRADPRVDAERIGLTGISWGGVMSEIAPAIDTRFKCAAPVYGCGFLGENSYWLETRFPEHDPANVARWLALWDPSQYVARIHMPVLFANGTNDKFFRPPSWQKTYRLVPGPVTLSMMLRLNHGHPPHGDPAAVKIFIDSILKKTAPLPAIHEQGREKAGAWIRFETAGSVSIEKAVLLYTADRGPWTERKWLQAPARLDATRASADVPTGASAYFFNLHDSRGAIVSSPHIEL